MPLFEVCLPHLAPGGCMLLFQAGGRADRSDLLAEAERQGWDCLYAVNWDKGATRAPIDTAEPYWASTERILVFTRKGDTLESCEIELSRSDIISVPTATTHAGLRIAHGKSTDGELHQFQKPAELMRILVRKHTFPGEVVVDVFGCSGVACIEAANLGRRWAYIESNKDNYDWGMQRIKDGLRALKTKAG